MSFNVLTAEFGHETNTFNKNSTDYDAFFKYFVYFGDDAITKRGHVNTELAGFCDCAREYGWKQTHVLSANAQPAGVVTRDAFDRLGGAIIEAAGGHNQRPDGILLALHGAMVTEFSEDGDGEFLWRLRAKVGSAVPIAVVLDAHGNVTQKMCELSNIIVSYKTYPHIDMRECGRHAGAILHRTMKREIRPQTLLVRRPMLAEVNLGRTDAGSMVERIARSIAYEREPDVLAVSVNPGFPYADIRELGPTVTVTYDGNENTHRAFAETIADDIWQKRFDVINCYLSVEEAAKIAKGYERHTGPLIIADYADNPGCGSYGDSTNLLKAIVEASIADAAFGPIVDVETAEQLYGHNVGDYVKIKLGGKFDPCFGGGPLELEGEVRLASDGCYTCDGAMCGGLSFSWGKTAVFRVGGIDILVVSEPSGIVDLQQFRAFGIDPAAKTVVGIKAMQHFRAAFEPIAGEIIVCDGGGLSTPRLEKLPYQNVPRPIFPLDREMSV
ncbi:M81 family metallopeptidase [Mesorhizobium sp. M0029]|uniref:M81 family metallopeptidase n=1 Tax=Mesorhizobium sp. M0029 TaxID=2956850 RepID=UPI00333A6062